MRFWVIIILFFDAGRVGKEGEISFARVAGECLVEESGDFLCGSDVCALAGSNSHIKGTAVHVHIQGNYKGGGRGAGPQSKVNYAVVTHHPSAHHVDFLVGGLAVALLAVNLYADFVGSKGFKGIICGVELPQAGADGCKFTPFYGAVEAGVFAAVVAGHNVIVWLPVHFIKCPFAVADNHVAAAPGKMSGNDRCNLHILESIFPSRQHCGTTEPVNTTFPLHNPCKMFWKNDGIACKILLFVILFRQLAYNIDFLFHNLYKDTQNSHILLSKVNCSADYG